MPLHLLRQYCPTSGCIKRHKNKKHCVKESLGLKCKNAIYNKKSSAKYRAPYNIGTNPTLVILKNGKQLQCYPLN